MDKHTIDAFVKSAEIIITNIWDDTCMSFDPLARIVGARSSFLLIGTLSCVPSAIVMEVDAFFADAFSQAIARVYYGLPEDNWAYRG